MQALILMFHLLVCIGIIVLVLLQQGKGADMGAAFGSGASNTLFGSRGPASFLMKVTGVLVALFFITSLSLDYYAGVSVKRANQLSAPPPVTQSFVPPPVPQQPNQSK